jgi:hypothetical protein
LDISTTVGIDGAAPIRCTHSDAATFAYVIAFRIGCPSASSPGMPVGRRYDIHVDAAGDEDLGHA